MTFESAIQAYGCVAVVFGCFLEGETVLVLAGFAAHRGYLPLTGVLMSAWIGTTVGDQLWYYVGRWRGRSFLDRRPSWKAGAARARLRLEKHELGVVLGFRFIYGARNLTPFVIGASGYPPRRFLLLNLVGALVWSLVVGGLGYLFGEGMSRLMTNVEKYEFRIMAGISILGVAAYLVVRIRRIRRG